VPPGKFVNPPSSSFPMTVGLYPEQR